MRVLLLLALIAAVSAQGYNYGYGMPELDEGATPPAPAAENAAPAAAEQAAPEQAAPEQAAPEQAAPEAAAEQAAPAEGEAAAAEGEKKEEEEKKKEEPRPAPMSPAKDYPANQNLPAAERPEYRCELCMMVIGRKLQRHTLCDNLEHESDVNTCRAVVETLTVYDRYLVDWLYGDGCQRESTGTWKNVKPCPAHVVCSWMIHTFADGEKRTFCQFEDKKYRRSPAFHAKHHIPTSEVDDLNSAVDAHQEGEN